MKISVITPTYNEEKYIGKLITFLQSISQNKEIEIIISDGGSTDNTIAICNDLNVLVLNSQKKGRSAQMNYAASFATGDIFYFIHADCLPPESCLDSVLKAIEENYDAGCFRYKFDSDKFLLKVNAFFNRFGGLICRGGDQTLFIKRAVFENLEGFCEKHIIMEDYEFVRRIMKKYRFKVIAEYALVYARKYEENSWAKVNFANAIAMYMFVSGSYSPQKIRNTYHSMIKHPKGQ